MTSFSLSNKAIILGAGGFIGINLAQELACQGFDLVCFDQYVSPHWPSTATAITGDFFVLPDRLLQELDHAIVFHLISSCRPSASTHTAADEVARDLASTIRYLEATKERQLRWVFISSGGTVYGPNNDRLIDELSPTLPICSYGAVKLSIERYLHLYHILHNTDYVTLRVANPYGPWQHPGRGQGIIATMLHKALNGESLEIWGDGTVVRDYIYIGDAVAGIIAGARKGRSGEIYNVGTANGLSINQLVDVINTTFKLDLKATYTPARCSDVPRNVLNSAKLRDDTGWHTKTTIIDGIKSTLDWFADYSRANLGTKLAQSH